MLKLPALLKGASKPDSATIVPPKRPWLTLLRLDRNNGWLCPESRVVVHRQCPITAKKLTHRYKSSDKTVRNHTVYTHESVSKASTVKRYEVDKAVA